LSTKAFSGEAKTNDLKLNQKGKMSLPLLFWHYKVVLRAFEEDILVILLKLV
jgi:hypothetical protein